jgi:4-nitrophenyl phosphatase
LFQQVRGVLLDMDGVVYHGSERLDGVLEFLGWLQAQQICYLYVTNNSSRTPQQVVQKLARMEIPANTNQIITSALVTAEYLKRRAQPGTPVYVVGEIGLVTAMITSGFSITDDHPRYVIVGLDRGFNETKLKTALAALEQGATLIATNRDRVLMTEQGIIPGAGSIVAQIEASSGQKALVMGKPERRIFEVAAQRLGLLPAELMMIGDNIETDIQGARNAGIMGVVVLTGITTKEKAAVAEVKPDVVADDLVHLISLCHNHRSDRENHQ